MESEAKLISSTKLSKGYQNWLDRFRRVLSAWNRKEIEIADLKKFQMFLFDMGQFNANFSLAELERLNYPRSPFAIMGGHAYLRATDTWAMEILRIKYQQTYNNNQIIPVWIDSPLFWHELERYCTVIKEEDIEHNFPTVASFQYPIWVKIKKAPDKKFNEHKRKVQQNIRKKLNTVYLNYLAESNEINPLLIDFFKTLLTGAPVKAEFIPANPFLLALDEIFPEVKAANVFTILSNILNGRTSKTKLSIPLINSLNELFLKENADTTSLAQYTIQPDNKWFKHIYVLARKYKIPLPTNVKKDSDLKSMFEQDSKQFLTILTNIGATLAYINSSKTWVETYITNKISKMLAKVTYFFQDSFQGLETIVFCDCSELEGFTTSVINNTGYRVDPVRVMRKILELFPLLFVDANETQQFWNLLVTLPMITALPDTEQKIIADLGEQIINDINKNYQLKPSSPRQFNYIQQLLITESPKLLSSLTLYLQFLIHFLTDYQSKANRAIRSIADPEIHQALELFFQAGKAANLATAIRQVQTISEIMSLTLEFQPLTASLSETIEKIYLKNYSVQKVHFTPYAMRSFVRVFQIVDIHYAGIQPSIYVTNQSYFEWLQNLERLDRKDAPINLVQHLSEIKEDADIIFAEIHPNNVVDTKQFAHDVLSLLNSLSTFSKKQRTLVIDATLNALTDPEVLAILNSANALVQAGYLNIILLQSLTKFAQLGLDKRSAGVITVINNKIHWALINQRLTDLSAAEQIDATTESYFSYFSIKRSQSNILELTRRYIHLINSNVGYVYQKINDNFNRLELFNRTRFQITLSSDPKACYIALNMNGLLPEVDDGFYFKLEDIENFSKDVLKYLIHPLCALHNLPLTERASIGFPLSSVNLVMDSLRFTIGLESTTELDHYSLILTYVAFVLNRQRDIELFMTTNKDGEYELRRLYFQEKVNQYKAMLPNSNFYYKTTYAAAGSENTHRNYDTNETHQLQRSVHIKNGNWYITREEPHPHQWGFVNRKYPPQSIYLTIRKAGHIQLSDPRITPIDKLMAVACFTQYTCPGKENYQNVNVVFENLNYTVSLGSMEIIGLWNAKYAYGPFTLNGKPLLFLLHQKQIEIIYNGKSYSESLILVRQGNVLTPLSAMAIDDKAFLFREGSYEPYRRGYGDAFTLSIDTQYIPRDDPIKISIESLDYEHRIGHRSALSTKPKTQEVNSSKQSSQLRQNHSQKQILVNKMQTLKIANAEQVSNKLIIERDFSCYQKPGVSIYRRCLGKNLTGIEIDFWGTKDPIFSRFLRLMTAIYIKEKYQISFIARDKRFIHFALAIAFDEVDKIVADIVPVILTNKVLLENILNDYQKNNTAKTPSNSEQYFFRFKTTVSWPSNSSSVDYIANKDLISLTLAQLQHLSVADNTSTLITSDQPPSKLTISYLQVTLAELLGKWEIGRKVENDIAQTLLFDEQAQIEMAMQASLKDKGVDELIKARKKALTSYAATFGYLCHDVPGDGNCFFHAVVDQLIRLGFSKTEANIDLLRKLVAKEIHEHNNYYKEFIHTQERSNYANHIGKSGVWVGMIAANAIVRIQKKIIAVIIPHDGGAPQVFKPAGATQVIVLGNEVDFHFQSLVANTMVMGKATNQLQLIIDQSPTLEDYPANESTTNANANSSQAHIFTKLKISPANIKTLKQKKESNTEKPSSATGSVNPCKEEISPDDLNQNDVDDIYSHHQP